MILYDLGFSCHCLRFFVASFQDGCLMKSISFDPHECLDPYHLSEEFSPEFHPQYEQRISHCSARYSFLSLLYEDLLVPFSYSFLFLLFMLVTYVTRHRRIFSLVNCVDYIFYLCLEIHFRYLETCGCSFNLSIVLYSIPISFSEMNSWICL